MIDHGASCLVHLESAYLGTWPPATTSTRLRYHPSHGTPFWGHLFTTNVLRSRPRQGRKEGIHKYHAMPLVREGSLLSIRQVSFGCLSLLLRSPTTTVNATPLAQHLTTLCYVRVMRQLFSRGTCRCKPPQYSLIRLGLHVQFSPRSASSAMHMSLKPAVLSRGLLKERSDVLAAALERMAVKVRGEGGMTRL